MTNKEAVNILQSIIYCWSEKDCEGRCSNCIYDVSREDSIKAINVAIAEIPTDK